MPSSLEQELHGNAARASAAVFIVMALLMGFPLLPAALRWPGRILAFGTLVYLTIAIIRGLRRVRWSVKGLVFSSVLLALMFAATHLLCLVFMKVMGARNDRLALRGEVTLTLECREQIAKLIADGPEKGEFDPRIGWVPRPGQRVPGSPSTNRAFARRMIIPQHLLIATSVCSAWGTLSPSATRSATIKPIRNMPSSFAPAGNG